MAAVHRPYSLTYLRPEIRQFGKFKNLFMLSVRISKERKERKRRVKWQIETRKRRHRGDETTGRNNEVIRGNGETTSRTCCPRFVCIDHVNSSGYPFEKRNVMSSVRVTQAIRSLKKIVIRSNGSGCELEKIVNRSVRKARAINSWWEKKSVKNRPQICPNYLFKNLHGMLPISLKL